MAIETKAGINPENLFVATVASAHMLSWLHVAFGVGAEVETYRDSARGVLTELSEGVYWVSEVILTPTITFNARVDIRNSWPNRQLVGQAV
jgi:organic hydroperoxide reductase OsmC/OhrA